MCGVTTVIPFNKGSRTDVTQCKPGLVMLLDGTLRWLKADGTLVPVPGAGGGAWGEAATAQFSGSGSPVGVVTPSGKGDLYVDEDAPALWQATGLTANDWQATGDSQSVKVIGPCVVEWSDLPEYGDSTDLFTLNIGQVIIGWWTDPETFVVFDQSGSGGYDYAFSIGQGAAYDAAQPAGQNGQTGGFGFPAASDVDFGPADAVSNLISGTARRNDNGDIISTLMKVITEALPVRAYNALEFLVGPLDQGHAELYFLVATPKAP